MKLSARDQHYLLAAQGWLELGNHVEAHAELDNIDTGAKTHPAVLELRWTILAKAGQWSACVEVANLQSVLIPHRVNSWVNLAFALHELKRTKEAKETLLAVVEQFPSEWIIPYNLACYCAQMGDLIGGRDWLAQAMRLTDARKLQAQALEDPDLAPLWSGDDAV